jgi:hypothetical protein
MPAPKRPNTAAATAASAAGRKRAAQERQADKLRADGWVVIPPEHATRVPSELPAAGQAGGEDRG